MHICVICHHTFGSGYYHSAMNCTIIEALDRMVGARDEEDDDNDDSEQPGPSKNVPRSGQELMNVEWTLSLLLLTIKKIFLFSRKILVINLWTKPLLKKNKDLFEFFFDVTEWILKYTAIFHELLI